MQIQIAIIELYGLFSCDWRNGSLLQGKSPMLTTEEVVKNNPEESRGHM